jgi:hypothetical protein
LHLSPTFGGFPGVRAMIGHAAAAPPMSVMISRLLEFPH